MSEVIQPGLDLVLESGCPIVHRFTLCPQDKEGGEPCDWETRLQVTRKPYNDASQTLLILHSVMHG